MQKNEKWSECFDSLAFGQNDNNDDAMNVVVGSAAVIELKASERALGRRVNRTDSGNRLLPEIERCFN